MRIPRSWLICLALLASCSIRDHFVNSLSGSGSPTDAAETEPPSLPPEYTLEHLPLDTPENDQDWFYGQVGRFKDCNQAITHRDMSEIGWIDPTRDDYHACREKRCGELPNLCPDGDPDRPSMPCKDDKPSPREACGRAECPTESRRYRAAATQFNIGRYAAYALCKG